MSASLICIAIVTYAAFTYIAHAHNHTCITQSSGDCTTINPTTDPTNLEPSLTPFPPIYLLLNTTNNSMLSTEFMAIFNSIAPSNSIRNTSKMYIIISSCICFLIVPIVFVWCLRRRRKEDKASESINDPNDTETHYPPTIQISMHSTQSTEENQDINGEIAQDQRCEITNNTGIKMSDIVGKHLHVNPVNNRMRIPSESQYTASNTARSYAMPNTCTDLRKLKSDGSNISDLFEEYDQEENENIRSSIMMGTMPSIGLCIPSRATSMNTMDGDRDPEIVTPGNSDIADIVMNVYDYDQGEQSVIEEIDEMIMDDASSNNSVIHIPGLGIKRAWL